MWFAIARQYRTRYVNDLLRIYYSTDPAQARLSRLTAATARGRLLFHKAVIEDYLDVGRHAPLLVLKSLVNYSRYSFLAEVGLRGQVAAVRTPLRKALVLVGAPAGFALHLRDRSRAPASPPAS